MVVEEREKSETRTETPASIPPTPDIDDNNKQGSSDTPTENKTPEEDPNIQVLSLSELSQIFKDGLKIDKDNEENIVSKQDCNGQEIVEQISAPNGEQLLEEHITHEDSEKSEIPSVVENLVTGDDSNGNELNDAKVHLSDATRRIHEMEIEIKRLESEREELSLAYREAETLRKQEEAKAQRLSSDLATLRHESERRIAQKEEEIESLRKQMALEIDQLSQRVAEAEAKVKTEVARIRKKMQIQITEIEMQLDVSNKQNIDLQKTVKIQSTKITELQSHYDEVHRQLQQCVDQLAVSQRRCQALTAELEEIRVTLEQTQRAKRQVEQSLEEVHGRVSELTTINVNLTSAKGKLENEYLSLQADYEEISKELRISDERYNRTVIELKSVKDLFVEEQERMVKIESIKKSLEVEVRTLQVRIEEVETNALAGGRRVVSKLEARIRDIEVELEEEKRRHSETQKLLRKKEHRTKELLLQTEEDHKTISMMNDSVEKLSEKVKVYKRQLNEQEGMTQQNLTRVRRYQRELEAAEDRADQAESNLTFIRSRHRTIVTSGPTSVKQVMVTTSTSEESSSAQY